MINLADIEATIRAYVLDKGTYWPGLEKYNAILIKQSRQQQMNEGEIADFLIEYYAYPLDKLRPHWKEALLQDREERALSIAARKNFRFESIVLCDNFKFDLDEVGDIQYIN